MPSPSVRAEVWRNLKGRKAGATGKAGDSLDDVSIGAETVPSRRESLSSLDTLVGAVSEQAENDESMFSLDEDWLPEKKKW